MERRGDHAVDMKPHEPEPDMNRGLEVVRDQRFYVIWEDRRWYQWDCETCNCSRKYTIHAASRPLGEEELRMSLSELNGFPTLFQVREEAECCEPASLGIFEAGIPDYPKKPYEPALLSWEDNGPCESCTGEPAKRVEGVDGELLGYAQPADLCTCSHSAQLFNAEGHLRYTIDTLCCTTGYQRNIMERGVSVGFIKKVFVKPEGSFWSALTTPFQNMAIASFPKTENMKDKLLLLREFVTQARMLEIERQG